MQERSLFMSTTVVAAGLFPHPPIMIPEIGGRELKKIEKTVTAEQKAMDLIVSRNPETAVVISPHNICYVGGPAIFEAETLSGSMAYFGHPELKMTLTMDQELTKAIEASAESTFHLIHVDEKKARQSGKTLQVDWGTFTPMYYLLKAGFKGKVVLLSPSFSSWETNEILGSIVERAAARLGRRVAIIASGDLSHKLTPDSPNGYTPKGKIFDEKVMDALKRRDKAPLLSMSDAFIDEIAMCGLPSVYFLFGILGNKKADMPVFTHEGPFGVGYGIALYLPTGEEEKPEEHDIRVRLARDSIEHYMKDHTYMKEPDPLPEELSGKAGVFVSLHEYGTLRGCIGTFRPTQKNIAREIIANAVAAGFEDPRFPALQPYEVKDLTISVDVLSDPEPVASENELDPDKYGVIVRKGSRLGLLLPHLDGVTTPEQQIEISKAKAGIASDETVDLFRFTVHRYF